MLHKYKSWNSAMATTAAQASVTTGTTIKTMLQIATPSTRQLMILGWGFSSDDPPGADGVIELIDVDVAATVTAHSASGVQPLDPGAPASLMTLGTSATGFTATAEGTPTASRCHDAVALSSTSAEAAPKLHHAQWFIPGVNAPIVAVSRFLRVRATTATTAIDLRTWICWCE